MSYYKVKVSMLKKISLHADSGEWAKLKAGAYLHKYYPGLLDTLDVVELTVTEEPDAMPLVTRR